MNESDADWVALLEQAVELANKSLGDVEPNPLVGALALQEGRVVGWGRHESWGGAHAEENALAHAKDRGAQPDTIVVTLEPCSSQGEGKKRPPCTQLLIDRGVRRVVIGALDPDPRHQGRAIQVLREAGLEVLGPFESPSLQEVLTRFRAGLELQRPWTVLKWAMTLDGKTGTRIGSSRWISGAAALDWAHRLRSHVDAVLVGIGTVIADDPLLNVRRVPGEDPLRVVVDPEGMLRPEHRLVQTREDAPLLVALGENAPDELPADVERVRLPVEPSPDSQHSRIVLEQLLRALFERGVRRLLVEGGGGLAADFVEQGLFDAVECVVAPKLCGGRNARTPVRGLGALEMSDSVPLVDLRTESLGDCMLLRALRDRASTGLGDSQI
jgi:diaminohydroxyphosphoribosylaminopyrimidine deaminase/5-amino-6-(5-phosphoribosylamino)uracil reductase